MADSASYDNLKRPAAAGHPHAQTADWIRARDLVKSFENGGVSIDVLQGVGLNLSIGESVAIVTDRRAIHVPSALCARVRVAGGSGCVAP